MAEISKSDVEKHSSYKFLDRPKAIKIVKEKLKKRKKIIGASVALAGDEFWNTETIYDGKKFINRKDFKCYPFSHWAVPILIIYFKDHTQLRLNCFFTYAESPTRAKKLLKQQAERSKKLWGKTRKFISKLKKRNGK